MRTNASAPATPLRIRFRSTLHRPANAGKAVTWTFLRLPEEVSAQLPSRGKASIEGTFNDIPFHASLEPDGKGGHWLKVDRALRNKAGAEPGDVISLAIAPTDKVPEPKVPVELREALESAPTEARTA